MGALRPWAEFATGSRFNQIALQEPATGLSEPFHFKDLEVSASTLTFTASNWDTPQTVVVTGVNDGLSDGDQAVDVTLSATGFDPVVVGVINADND